MYYLLQQVQYQVHQQSNKRNTPRRAYITQQYTQMEFSSKCHLNVIDNVIYFSDTITYFNDTIIYVGSIWVKQEISDFALQYTMQIFCLSCHIPTSTMYQCQPMKKYFSSVLVINVHTCACSYQQIDSLMCSKSYVW